MDLFTNTLTPEEIVALPGFEEALTLYLTPKPGRELLTTSSALDAYLRREARDATCELFRVLYLDKKNCLLADVIEGRGTVDHAPVYPREVAKRALELGACAVILSHNHPSGDPAPSTADIQMTERLAAALGVFGIAVHDHIIVGHETLSLRAKGLM